MENLKSICFVNSTTGYIAGSNGKIYKTTDDGTWILEDVPTQNDLNSIFFVSDSLGFAVGAKGTILVCHSPGASGNGSEVLVGDNQVTAYPNPAAHAITIATDLAVASVVKLDLFQMNGQWVKNMANKMI